MEALREFVEIEAERVQVTANGKTYTCWLLPTQTLDRFAIYNDTGLGWGVFALLYYHKSSDRWDWAWIQDGERAKWARFSERNDAIQNAYEIGCGSREDSRG